MMPERNGRHHRRRVVVTGIGLITPVGNEVKTFWDNVSKGRSAAAPITRFDTSKLPVRIGAEVKDFSISRYAAIRDSRLDRTVQFGVAAATLALRDSGYEVGNLADTRTGIVEGTTISGAESILKSQQKFLEKNDYKRLHPYNIVSGYCGEGSSAISQYLGLKGAAITYCSGCASGNDAIGHATNLIKSDQFDLMVAGGSEQMQEMLFLGFCRLRSMPENDGEPFRAMKPFDRNRGFGIPGPRRTRSRVKPRCADLRGSTRARSHFRGVSSDRPRT
jgi:3-oxoacyl-[acyl-carrier-protein] synthase II